MKLVRRFSLATLSAAALAMFAVGSAQAESTYGYNAAGSNTPAVKATARVKIEVKVPLLILLRVGKSGAFTDPGAPVGTTNKATTEVVSLQAAFSGIPGGIAAGAFADGDSKASGWDGTAPLTAVTSTPTSVQAWAWTNSKGGGSLSGAVTTPFNTLTSGLTSAHIAVSTAVGGTLAHPGALTNAFTPATTFPRNTAVTGDWTYSINAAGLAAMNPGTDSQVITYTATAM